MAWLPVAGATELGPGDFIQVDIGDIFVLVCNVNGELFAIEDQCTHDGSSMAAGYMEDDQMVCPRHGARFCLRTGDALTPPAYEPVKKFPVRIHGPNIEVEVPG
jgi:3-phenylpropionate/trans-cinnamate dioxygenase ferredoxin subunit